MNENTAQKLDNEVSEEEQLDLEVEVIDDTPDEDKNKTRNENAPKDNIPEEEEIKKNKKLKGSSAKLSMQVASCSRLLTHFILSLSIVYQPNSDK